MAEMTKTFRVFVSSTFKDLEAERNYFREHVYERLREVCEERGARFQPIDLRWGVSEEASLDQQAMNVCLREIERCLETTPRPNFVVLLGNRHGWLAPAPEIPADEFDALLVALEGEWDEIRDEIQGRLSHAYGKIRAAVEDLRVPRDGGSVPVDLSVHRDVARAGAVLVSVRRQRGAARALSAPTREGRTVREPRRVGAGGVGAARGVGGGGGSRRVRARPQVPRVGDRAGDPARARWGPGRSRVMRSASSAT